MQAMIKEDRLPIALSMTIFTLTAIDPLMLVVFPVTGVAVKRRVLKGRCQMAFFTFHRGMFPHQWKAGLIVVEGGFLP